MRFNSGVLPLLPIALIAVVTFWSGTFWGAAGGWAAIIDQGLILAFAVVGAAALDDPLQLGPKGRWLLLVLLLCVIASWILSPVERAGRVGVVLLPALLLLPAATAHCWSNPSRERLIGNSVALLTVAVTSLALVRWYALDLPRASLPLGHHNLLACWLVLVLPMGLIGLRHAGADRWLAAAGGMLGLVTLAATGSLLGVLAVALQLTVLAWRKPEFRTWGLGLAALAVLASLPRLLAILQTADLSAMARASYFAAAWHGFLARPWAGWGPGATAWTLGEFMQPVAGIHPASQIIGEPHNLPARLGYELGWPGLLAAAAVGTLFIARRWRQTVMSEERQLPWAALLGLLGGVFFSLGASPLAVTALPVTGAVVAGATLARPAPVRRVISRSFSVLYVLLCGVTLLPLDHAHLLYDRARSSRVTADAIRLIDRAAATDPGFPLYAARRAWLAAETAVDAGVAEAALKAAEMAPGLAPLWLAAGDLGRRAEQAWAPEALAIARRLDPLSPLVAFALMTAEPDGPDAAALGMEAVRGEPRLARAAWWRDHPQLARSVGGELDLEIGIGDETGGEPRKTLALAVDRVPALSFSLHAFRRRPWAGHIAPVELLGSSSARRQAAEGVQ